MFWTRHACMHANFFSPEIFTLFLNSTADWQFFHVCIHEKSLSMTALPHPVILRKKCFEQRMHACEFFSRLKFVLSFEIQVQTINFSIHTCEFFFFPEILLFFKFNHKPSFLNMIGTREKVWTWHRDHTQPLLETNVLNKTCIHARDFFSCLKFLLYFYIQLADYQFFHACMRVFFLSEIILFFKFNPGHHF